MVDDDFLDGRDDDEEEEDGNIDGDLELRC